MFQYVSFVDDSSPEDSVLAKFERAVATVKGGLLVVRALSLQLEQGTGEAGGAEAGAVNAAAPAEEGGLCAERPVPDGALRVVRAAGGCLGLEEAGDAAAVGFEGAVSRVDDAMEALNMRRRGPDADADEAHRHVGGGGRQGHGQEEDEEEGEERGIVHGGAAGDDGDDGDYCKDWIGAFGHMELKQKIADCHRGRCRVASGVVDFGDFDYQVRSSLAACQLRNNQSISSISFNIFPFFHRRTSAHSLFIPFFYLFFSITFIPKIGRAHV